MEKAAPTWTLAALAAQLQGEAFGPPDLPLRRPVSAGDDDPEGITFAESDKYLVKVEESGVGAVLVGPDMQTTKPHIRVAAPRVAFFMLLHASQKTLSVLPGSAVIDPTAKVDPTAIIGAFVTIGANAEIGPKAVIHPHCFIGDRSVVGEGTVLFPRVTLYHDVKIGKRCALHAGVVVGADGFGYVWDGKHRMKVPQIGGVIIGDDVEIGSNTCVDRATAGDTTIGNGCKFDDMVHIGHNVHIGEHVVIAGLCGIAGSVTLGDRCTIAGSVVVKDHVTICADVTLGGRTGVDSDITEPGQYFGMPARPAREALRTYMLVPKLPEIWSRLRKLEKAVEDRDI